MTSNRLEVIDQGFIVCQLSRVELQFEGLWFLILEENHEVEADRPRSPIYSHPYRNIIIFS